MVTQNHSPPNEAYGCLHVKEPVLVLSYIVREELLKAPVLLQVSLCYLLSLNILVQMHLLFFF